LNDWVVDFANGGTLGYTQVISQMDDFLTALGGVDWDNALFALTGDHSTDEDATIIQAYIELAADFLSKHRPSAASSAPSPAPTVSLLLQPVSKNTAAWVP